MICVNDGFFAILVICGLGFYDAKIKRKNEIFHVLYNKFIYSVFTYSFFL